MENEGNILYLKELKKNKWLILIITVSVVFIASVLLSFVSKTWTSTIKISEIKYSENLKQDYNNNVLNGNIVLNLFVSLYESDITKSNFINGSEFYKKKLIELPDNKETNIKKWSDDFSVKLLNDGDYSLSITSDSPDNNKKLLNDYIRYVNKIVDNNIINDMYKVIDNKIEQINIKKHRYENVFYLERQQEIIKTKFEIEIAKKANVINPILINTGNDIFNISLGVKGLEEKLVILKSSSNELFYNTDYINLISELKVLGVNRDNIFSKLINIKHIKESILENKYNSPSYKLIILLSTFFGAFLSCFYIILITYFKDGFKDDGKC